MSFEKLIEDIEKKRHHKDPFDEKYLDCVLNDFNVETTYDASQNVFLRREIISQMQKKLQKEVEKYSSITKTPSKKVEPLEYIEEDQNPIDDSKFEELQKIVKEKVLPDLIIDIKKANTDINILSVDDFDLDSKIELKEPKEIETDFDLNVLELNLGSTTSPLNTLEKDDFKEFSKSQALNHEIDVIETNDQEITVESSVNIVKNEEPPMTQVKKKKEKKERKEMKYDSFQINQMIRFGPCKIPEKGKVKKLKLKDNFKENLIEEKKEIKVEQPKDPLIYSLLFKDINLFELTKNQDLKKDVPTLIEEIMTERCPEIEYKEKIQKKICVNISKISNYIREKLNEKLETKDEEIVNIIHENNEGIITKQRVFMAMVHFAHQNNTKSDNQVLLSEEDGGICLKKTK